MRSREIAWAALERGDAYYLHPRAGFIT